MTAAVRSHDGRYIFFEVKSPEELDYAHITDLQIEAGYHPAGYGGPIDVKEIRMVEGERIYRWKCYGNAD